MEGTPASAAPDGPTSVLGSLQELRAALQEVRPCMESLALPQMNEAVLSVNATVHEMNCRMHEFEKKLFRVANPLQSSLYDFSMAQEGRNPAA